MPEKFTVFHDDGRMPHFDKYDSREKAEARVKELHDKGMISAIILEDYDE